MIQLSDSDFDQEVLRSAKPVLVDFWAPWCGPCRMMEKVIEGLEGKEGPPTRLDSAKRVGEAGIGGKVKIGKVNVDENPQTASKYGIMSIPTLILFRNGKEVKRVVGVRGKEELVKLVKLV